MSRVGPYVEGKGWDYTILLVHNGEFKREKNVNHITHTYLFEGSGKIVAQKNNYSAGDEDNLFEEIKKLSIK